jgi:hypothetical protein
MQLAGIHARKVDIPLLTSCSYHCSLNNQLLDAGIPSNFVTEALTISSSFVSL